MNSRIISEHTFASTKEEAGSLIAQGWFYEYGHPPQWGHPGVKGACMKRIPPPKQEERAR